jgi:hypothetical protein
VKYHPSKENNNSSKVPNSLATTLLSIPERRRTTVTGNLAFNFSGKNVMSSKTYLAAVVLSMCAVLTNSATAGDPSHEPHASEHQHHHGDDKHATEHDHHHGKDGHKNEHEHHHGEDGHKDEHEHHHGEDGHKDEHEHHHLDSETNNTDEHHHHGADTKPQ